MTNESDTDRQIGFNHVNGQAVAKPMVTVIGGRERVVDITECLHPHLTQWGLGLDPGLAPTKEARSSGRGYYC